jgi:hypothetical protein
LRYTTCWSLISLMMIRESSIWTLMAMLRK